MNKKKKKQPLKSALFGTISRLNVATSELADISIEHLKFYHFFLWLEQT